MTGWTLTDSNAESPAALVFGADDQCSNITTLEPAEVLVLEPKSETNVCGLTFGVSFRCVPSTLPQLLCNPHRVRVNKSIHVSNDHLGTDSEAGPDHLL